MGVAITGVVVNKPFGIGDIGSRIVPGIIKCFDEKKTVVQAPAAVGVFGAYDERVDAGRQAGCIDACGEAGDICAG